MYHIYQRPYSPKAQQCADLIVSAGSSYQVHLVQNRKDLQDVYRRVGRQVTLPRVFTEVSEGGRLHHIGGVPKIRTWLTLHPPEDVYAPRPATMEYMSDDRLARVISHEEAVTTFREAMRGHSVSLRIIGRQMAVASSKEMEQVMRMLKSEAQGEPTSLPFYVATGASAHYRLNSCGIMMDSSTEHLYNVVWVKEESGGVSLKAYDPVESEWVEIGDGQYRAVTGEVIVP